MNASTYMRESWARVISDVLSPPVVWGVMVFSIAFHLSDSNQNALLWAGVYAVLVCIIPVIYIGWMVRRGKISDIHMKYRRERIGPFLVSIGCAALAWQALRMMDAPYLLPLIAGVTLVQLIVMSLITVWWQISMHSMSIMVAVVATGMVFGLTPALAISPLVPIVGAARLRLQRHTFAQVLAGALLGAAIPVLLLQVYR